MKSTLMLAMARAAIFTAALVAIPNVGTQAETVSGDEEQGFMVHKSHGVSSATELDGAAVCVQIGTITEINLADYFHRNGMKYQPVRVDTKDEARQSYSVGRCDVYTADVSELDTARSIFNPPEDHVILPETISGIAGRVVRKKELVQDVVHGSTPELAVPQLINYQGKLVSASGRPPPTKEYTLSFSIYDHPTAAPCTTEPFTPCARLVWGPQVFDGTSDKGHGAQVPVVRGFFNVILGPVDVHGLSIMRAFASSNRFVEVAVENDDPVLPRQQVFSAPFALRSMGDAPVGGIIPFIGNPNDLPENWKVCNGQEITDPESRYFGKRVVDLRDKFIRGSREGEKPGHRAEGDHTLRIEMKHRHKFEDTAQVNMDKFSVSVRRSQQATSRAISSFSEHDYVLLYNKRDGESHGHRGTVDVSGRTSFSGNRLSADNRPRHMALHYIIRIK